MANLDSILRSRGMDDDMIRAYMSNQTDLLGQALDAQRAKASIDAQNRQSQNQLFGSLLSAGGTLGAALGK